MRGKPQVQNTKIPGGSAQHMPRLGNPQRYYKKQIFKKVHHHFLTQSLSTMLRALTKKNLFEPMRTVELRLRMEGSLPCSHNICKIDFRVGYPISQKGVLHLPEGQINSEDRPCHCTKRELRLPYKSGSYSTFFQPKAKASKGQMLAQAGCTQSLMYLLRRNSNFYAIRCDLYLSQQNLGQKASKLTMAYWVKQCSAKLTIHRD